VTDQDEADLEERSDIREDPVDEYVDDDFEATEGSNSENDFAKVSVS
jgi:hypothetical protein